MRKKWTVLAVAFGMLSSALGVSAQDVKERQRKEQVEVFVEQNGPEGLPPKVEMGGDTSLFIATEMSFGGKTVKGAPYSAQAVTESVQALADGNRIVHKTTSQVYRDSEGRTRREQTIGSIGPYAAAGDPVQTYFINDPVAHVSYILDPRTKTARKMEIFEFKIGSDDKEGGVTVVAPRAAKEAADVATTQRAAKEGEARTFVFQTATPQGEGGGGGVMYNWSKADTKSEKLGSQTVEGVQADGTRITTTIPAGAIGNEQPIQIVNETWYSPELQLVVKTTHSDPRFGETTYRLTNIQRAEPSPVLFQVPSDYTVKEGPGFRTMRRERMLPPQQQEN